MLMLMDFTDPPFIENKIYEAIFYIALPIFCGASFIYLQVLVIKKYRRCSDYREHLKDSFSDTKMKLSLIFIYPLLPLLIYATLYFLLSAPIELWAYYTQGDYWYKEYILTDVQECGSDYEDSCTRLYFKDPTTNKTHDFRWYDDKSTIMFVWLYSERIRKVINTTFYIAAILYKNLTPVSEVHKLKFKLR